MTRRQRDILEMIRALRCDVAGEITLGLARLLVELTERATVARWRSFGVLWRRSPGPER